jgi:chromosomal replication initiator protein
MINNEELHLDYTHIWDQVVEGVVKESNSPNLQVLLNGTKPIDMRDGTLYIQFPNAFARDWVETRHMHQLTAKLHKYTRDDMALHLLVNGERGVIKIEEEAKPKISSNGQIKPEVSSPSRRTGPDITVTNSEPVTSQSLNPKYTFDTFVVGPSNRFAHAASLAAASEPATVYNPLFLYGGVGLGKTHLMQAIGHYVLSNHPHMHVVYVSSERFTNDLINALQTKSMVEFRQRYRNVDVLLIDDIQFVAGKESTQIEFFHTFNALYQANKQIVISSDRSPKEIPTLEDRLRSRFEWGLTADLQAPDMETRVAILRQKALSENFSIPDEVLDFIAANIQSNIRELEGALIRVMAYSSLHSKPVTSDLAAEALKNILSLNRTKKITITTIQDSVSAYFGIKPSEIKGKRRSRAVVIPRQVAMYICRELTDSSLPRIGEEFGGKDHTTVLHACEKVKKDIENDPSLAGTIRFLINSIQSQG